MAIRLRTISSFVAAAVLTFGGASAANAAPAPDTVTRNGAMLRLDGHQFRFGAANEYWLGLDENVGGIDYPTSFRIHDGLATAKAMGATVIRAHTLGISTANPKSVEPSLGVFNAHAFSTIDDSIAAARRLGLRLIIPLTDNWHWYHGGKHDFTDWLGLPESAFYTDPQAIAAFEAYIEHLLDHRNPLTGQRLRDDPTIMAWELGNELNDMPASWINTISAFLKKLSPHHLVAAGQQSGINPATLTAPDVDIVDVHYYPPTTAQIESDAATVAAADKVYIAGEYGSTSAGDSLLQPLATDPNVTGAAFWSLFPHRDDYGYVQHNDGFTLHYPGDNPAMTANATAIRSFNYAIRHASVPPIPAPDRSVITALDRTSDGVTIAWRGATTAADYSVWRQSGDRWQLVCDRCATDNDTPWTDGTAPAGPLTYRVVGYTAEGRAGATSAPAHIS